jgi:hypothetical protein
VTGVAGRRAFTATSIEQTLARVKQRVEQEDEGSPTKSV